MEKWRGSGADGGGALQGEPVDIAEGMPKGLPGLFMRDPQGVSIELVEMLS
ncbi:MAG: hypothetical protein KDJ80_06510 [Nitratireductor sp.]|nr:hypothetical protein [Nitratireductor sp.]